MLKHPLLQSLDFLAPFSSSVGTRSLVSAFKLVGSPSWVGFVFSLSSASSFSDFSFAGLAGCSDLWSVCSAFREVGSPSAVGLDLREDYECQAMAMRPSQGTYGRHFHETRDMNRAKVHMLLFLLFNR